MSLAQAIHLVAVDVEQIIRLFHQLFDVPTEIQELFRLVDNTHSALLKAGVAVATQNVSVLFDDYLLRFKNFRDNFLDLELFIDPDQILPRSGPNSHDRAVFPWSGAYAPETVEFCNSFQETLQSIEDTCQSLISALPK
jgi:hypothetical protein